MESCEILLIHPYKVLTKGKINIQYNSFPWELCCNKTVFLPFPIGSQKLKNPFIYCLL